MSNEEKKIEDYLHLYLGCEVQIDDARGTFIDALTHMNNLGDCSGHEYEWEAKNCALILRPLSDIRVFELDEIYKLINPDNWQNHNQTEFASHAHGWIFNGKGSLAPQDRFKPSIFLYLLKKGFDLFDLIESGLAIDKTTLNVTPS